MAHRNLTANHIASPSFGIAYNLGSCDQDARKNSNLLSERLKIQEIKFCSEVLSTHSDSNNEDQETPNFRTISDFDPFENTYPNSLSQKTCDSSYQVNEKEQNMLILQDLLDINIEDINFINENPGFLSFPIGKNFRACGCKLF
ncbi:hypothetical protein SteCoe_26618 [Stentor coeruleus]|uniref:Uncharacterized protein n=1 Tax=Stentor coeruleus TaxID=5963 RepID=A0A1R2BCE5_9CILI|nr:hypothetical protein SteCoe_26618 [Stentor coeruleus]